MKGKSDSRRLHLIRTCKITRFLQIYRLLWNKTEKDGQNVDGCTLRTNRETRFWQIIISLMKMKGRACRLETNDHEGIPENNGFFFHKSRPASWWKEEQILNEQYISYVQEGKWSIGVGKKKKKTNPLIVSDATPVDLYVPCSSWMPFGSNRRRCSDARGRFSCCTCIVCDLSPPPL